MTGLATTESTWGSEKPTLRPATAKMSALGAGSLTKRIGEGFRDVAGGRSSSDSGRTSSASAPSSENAPRKSESGSTPTPAGRW